MKVKGTLRIRDWEKHFENNRTRDMKNMSWIPVPNKHDGDGYTILVDHKNGAAHLGAWMVILQVASKCDPRGTLLRGNGRPHNAGSISRVTRIPEQIIEEAVNRLCGDEIGWLEIIDSLGNPTIPQEGAGSPQVGAEKPQEGIPLGKGRKGRKEDTANQPSGDVAEQKQFLLSKRKRKLQGDMLEWFKAFWKAFDHKRGRAEAIDAWMDIPAINKALAQEICKAAGIEAKSRQSLAADRTPIMAQGWLAGRRWEDEPTPSETTNTPVKPPTKAQIAGLEPMS